MKAKPRDKRSHNDEGELVSPGIIAKCNRNGKKDNTSEKEETSPVIRVPCTGTTYGDTGVGE